MKWRNCASRLDPTCRRQSAKRITIGSNARRVRVVCTSARNSQTGSSRNFLANSCTTVAPAFPKNRYACFLACNSTTEARLESAVATGPLNVARCGRITHVLLLARYKFVAQVTIVQRNDQAIHAGFQSLWDAERDNYSCYVFENNHIYAWCCVFGIYYE